MKKYLFLAATALMLTACSSEEEVGSNPVEIRLTSGLTVQQAGLRATTNIQNTQFDSGEKIDVYISEGLDEGEYTTTTYESPLAYTTGDNGVMTPPEGKQPYFPASGNKVNITAVYPSATVGAYETNDEGNVVSFTIETDQSTDANYKKSDIMIAQKSGVARTHDAVELTFQHMLSKVTVKLKSGDGTPDLDGAIVELQSVKPIYSYNEADDVMEADGTPTAIKVMETTTDKLEGSAIIVPQELATSFIKVTLADGGTLTSNGLKDKDGNPITGNIKFEGGKVYTYEITVNLTGINITSSISDWTDGGKNSGTATMEQ